MFTCSVRCLSCALAISGNDSLGRRGAGTVTCAAGVASCAIRFLHLGVVARKAVKVWTMEAFGLSNGVRPDFSAVSLVSQKSLWFKPFPESMQMKQQAPFGCDLN